MRVLPAFLLILPTVLSKPILVQEEATLAYMPWEVEHAEHPHHPPSPPDLPSDESKSIYEILEGDERFSYVTKAIKFTETVDFYKDSSASLTFFAPPNDAFPHHDHDEEEHHGLEFISQAPLSEIMAEVESLDFDCGEELDDKDKEKRRKVLKIIAHSILAYHTIPHKLSSVQLGENSTHATNLTLAFDLYGGQPLRVKASNSGLHPTLRLNLLTRVTGPDVAASNGYIHVVSFPLVPPPPAFAELFWGISAFSTFTSAIQRVSLLDALDIRYVPDKDEDRHGKLEGAKAVTVFAPVNDAFKKLPEKLKIFLFSPFGTRILRKLLQYHIVPNYILLTDYSYNVSSNAVSPARVPPDHGPQPIFETKAKVPTLLANHTLDISIAKYNFTLPFPGPRPAPPRIVTKFEVDGHKVGLADLPALNGAVHVIGRVLNPVRDHGHKKHPHPGMPCADSEEEDSWDDWEDWLIDWAEEN